MINPKDTPTVNIDTDEDFDTDKRELIKPAGLDNNTGPDTTGVGQPTMQPINQGNSLPATAIPVERKFLDQHSFYDPEADKQLSEAKNRNNVGGAKAVKSETDL